MGRRNARVDLQPGDQHTHGRPRSPSSVPRRWIRKTTCGSCECSALQGSAHTASTSTQIPSGCCLRPIARSTGTTSTRGRVLEIITIPESEPDAHGLALKDGYLYYCDSGLTAPGPGSAPGQVCRFRVDTARATN